MPRKVRSTEAGAKQARKPRRGPTGRAFRVLLVEPESKVRRTLSQSIAGEQLTVVEADSLAAARKQLASTSVDLALIDPTLPDGSGMQLARELAASRRQTQTIVISGEPSLEQAIDAIRAGVADFIVKPLDMRDLNERVRQAMDRQRRDEQREQRNRRLRRLCRKLNEARQEVTEQVDVLCNDLVTAYQELASQMQTVARTSEYAGLIRDELDLEGLLRKTLEFLVQKAGPTNAAIFLPSNADEYTLGGYVNYDCTADSADVLLQHLADVVAPLMTDCRETVHITDNETLRKWIGDDHAYLADSHVLAFTSMHQNETLAVLVLFRDGAMPFSAELVESLGALAPMMGDYLARIIRIHHRHVPDFEHDDGEVV